MTMIDRRAALGQLAFAAATMSTKAFAFADAPRCPRTGEDIEGPFFLPGAPRRTQLIEPGMQGTPLELEGVLRDTACRPIANARVELWQCDALGRYDARGMRLRTTIETDSRGRWGVRTIVPGRYLNGATYRPAHIHVKAHGPRGVLTTQMYFEGDPYNAADPWFRRERAVALVATGRELRGRFDIALAR
ncbi:MAG: hypothetical protein U0269_12885 [Polyangiales bacterium]